jgi:hypothetical protein
VRARPILRPQHDGRCARQLGSLVGDEAVELVRRASEHFYAPVPASPIPAYAYKGEFFYRTMGGAFTSLSDLIAQATSGKQQTLNYSKVGVASVAGAAEVGWGLTGMPGAGANPSALTAGNVPTNATAGSLAQTDPAGADTLNLTTISMTPYGNAALLILYDRIWHAALNTNSASQQPITGTPTRYNTVDTTAVGNFCFPYVRGTGTNLAATAHNHSTGCTYVNQHNAAAAAFVAQTGVSGCTYGRVDLATFTGQWFMPLNTGDTGMLSLTNWQLSAACATGQLDIAMGHPLAYVPMPASGVGAVLDGINSAFNLIQIQTGACLDCIWIRPATTATSVTGQIVVVSGT